MGVSPSPSPTSHGETARTYTRVEGPREGLSCNAQTKARRNLEARNPSLPRRW
jgi:hypothetical protein